MTNSKLLALALMALVFAAPGCSKEEQEKAKQSANDAAKKAGEAIQSGAEKAKEGTAAAMTDAQRAAADAAAKIREAADNAAAKMPTREEAAAKLNATLAGFKDKLAGMNVSLPKLSGDQTADKASLTALLEQIKTAIAGLDKAQEGLANVKAPGGVNLGGAAPDAKALEQKRSVLDDLLKQIQPMLESMQK